MKQGFLLIELMIYIGLSLALILVGFKSTALLTKQLRGTHENSFKIIQWYTAMRALEYDLETASANLECWQKMESCKLQWVKDNKRITWKIKEKKLFRCVAHFDAIKKQWKREGRSLLADHVTLCDFKVNRASNQIDYIHSILKGELSVNKTITMEQSVWPMCSRVLL